MNDITTPIFHNENDNTLARPQNTQNEPIVPTTTSSSTTTSTSTSTTSATGNSNNTNNRNSLNSSTGSNNSSSGNTTNETTIESTKLRLLFEYEKLKEINLRGLYVIPSLNSIFEWHNVLFIRNRVYRSSVIRFLIIIPDDYPNSCPSVKFQTPVFHPLVGMDGEFELQHHFPDWKAEKYMIPHILCYIKNIFHNPEKFDYPPLNPEAAKLLKEDYEEFLRKVSHFVKLSIQNVYENPQFSSIVFAQEWKDKTQFENTKNNVLKRDTTVLGKIRQMEYLDFSPSDSFQAAVDDSWVLSATFLVFFTQAGYCMLEAGVVRAKNAKSIIIKSIIDTAFGSLIFWAVGFAFAFGHNNNPFLGTSHFFLIRYDNLAFFAFQWAFSTTSITIVSGSLAERVHINSCLIYTVVMSAIIYPITAHWVWSKDGWLRLIGTNGIVDFAGGVVVHMVGGAVGLMGTYIVGPRIGRFDSESGKPKPLPGHSITLSTLGAFIIWYGFYGYNTGSTLGISMGRMAIASRSAVTMTISATASCATTLMVIKLFSGKYDVNKSVNGLLGGLVSASASCSMVDPWAGFVIGCVSSFVYLGTSKLLLKLRIDDPLDSAPIHFSCGMWGAISVGLFATQNDLEKLLVRPTNSYGLFYGGGVEQLGVQLLGVVCVALWCFLISGILFVLMKRFNLLRIDPTRELMGIDMDQHGGPAYPNFQNI
ncbi:ammonium transporter [Heterostelium album PN500]|uniref:Ammonium transporter n=1 Tax=Heterostelium pallidum (strain ATCC 26659 / Pp 5 / PN500) TaxID=670386 RepID=D3BBH9_HETP5|nr:ammonium transporter [Heterostelium album PN500]EFA81012.1 ammonium transporter [Heterostelium album PN500]|eukprot:XP_020433130.1 ammonium transporter [Heterostelium album PN500]